MSDAMHGHDSFRLISFYAITVSVLLTQVTGLNCEAPINQPLHALFVARSGVDLPVKLYKAKAAAGQRFKVQRRNDTSPYHVMCRQSMLSS